MIPAWIIEKIKEEEEKQEQEKNSQIYIEDIPDEENRNPSEDGKSNRIYQVSSSRSY